ncbi:hypothetical protein [Chryseobacterium taiwanense]|nr:hypothetical protein [Chryseobacterium taiwanense]
MKKQIEKKLSLKKIQITKLNMIRGGEGNDDTMTVKDTTTSKNCPPKPADTAIPPVVILGGDDNVSKGINKGLNKL